MSIFIIDADGLKDVNDQWGHLIGDRMLIAIADVLKQSFRPGDVVARIGVMNSR